MCSLCETDRLHPCTCLCKAEHLYEDEDLIILCANCGGHTVQIHQEEKDAQEEAGNVGN